MPAGWFGACCLVNSLSTCQTSMDAERVADEAATLSQGRVSGEGLRVDSDTLERGSRVSAQAPTQGAEELVGF